MADRELARGALARFVVRSRVYAILRDYGNTEDNQAMLFHSLRSATAREVLTESRRVGRGVH